MNILAAQFLATGLIWGIAGCSFGRLMVPLERPPSDLHRKSALEACVTDQVNLYWDVCAESSNGYEAMTGTDAYFEGVKCAVESIKACQGDI